MSWDLDTCMDKKPDAANRVLGADGKGSRRRWDSARKRGTGGCC